VKDGPTLLPGVIVILGSGRAERNPQPRPPSPVLTQCLRIETFVLRRGESWSLGCGATAQVIPGGPALILNKAVSVSGSRRFSEEGISLIRSESESPGWARARPPLVLREAPYRFRRVTKRSTNRTGVGHDQASVGSPGSSLLSGNEKGLLGVDSRQPRPTLFFCFFAVKTHAPQSPVQYPAADIKKTKTEKRPDLRDPAIAIWRLDFTFSPFFPVQYLFSKVFVSVK